MARKIEEAELKKECPSCGLGVALDSKICEFCGWDFEEEDEWILQIEKLERELIMEKQKFTPGSVDQKIEATLHTPPPRSTGAGQPAVVETPPTEEAAATRPVRKVKTASAEGATPTDTTADETAESDTASAVRETDETESVRVRAVKPAQAPAGGTPEPAKGEGDRKTKRVRVVRKVKK